jgi:hypothetical protein
MKAFLTSALGLTLLLCGCLRAIPPSISSTEYSVYSAWLKAHVANRQVERDLLISDHTFPISNLDPDECGLGRLAQPLIALGDSEYRLGIVRPEHAIDVPFEYRLVGDMPENPSRAFEEIAFSRVSFNVAGSEGVFAVTTSGCQPRSAQDARLVCGGGRSYFVRASQQRTGWRFEPLKQCVRVE